MFEFYTFLIGYVGWSIGFRIIAGVIDKMEYCRENNLQLKHEENS